MYINIYIYLYIVGYYSVLKRKEILIHVTMRMNFENIVLCERCLLLFYKNKKGNTVCFHLYEVLEVVRFLQTEVEWWLLGLGDGELVFHGHRISDAKFWSWMLVMTAQQCECT